MSAATSGIGSRSHIASLIRATVDTAPSRNAAANGRFVFQSLGRCWLCGNGHPERSEAGALRLLYDFFAATLTFLILKLTGSGMTLPVGAIVKDTQGVFFIIETGGKRQFPDARTLGALSLSMGAARAPTVVDTILNSFPTTAPFPSLEALVTGHPAVETEVQRAIKAILPAARIKGVPERTAFIVEASMNLFDVAMGKANAEQHAGVELAGNLTPIDIKIPGVKDTGDKEFGEKDFGDKEQGDKEHGDKEAGDKEPSDKEQGQKEVGDKEFGDKDFGDKEHDEKDEGDKDTKDIGDKEAGDKEPGDKEQGQKEFGEKEVGEKEQNEKEVGEKEHDEFEGPPGLVAFPGDGAPKVEGARMMLDENKARAARIISTKNEWDRFTA